MANANSRFINVFCESCSCEGSIRIDQYSRKNGTWRCRSCTKQGQVPANKGTGVKNDPDMLKTRSSYYKAKYRCKTGHRGYYVNIEFRFTSLQELVDEIGIRPEGTSLDRIDNLGHYEPGNVRWATAKEQAANRRARNSVSR